MSQLLLSKQLLPIIHSPDPYAQLLLGLRETLLILGINQEDDAVHLGEVLLPELSGYA